MAKVYILTEADFEALRSALREDHNIGRLEVPRKEREEQNETYRRFNYRVETWIQGVMK